MSLVPRRWSLGTWAVGVTPYGVTTNGRRATGDEEEPAGP